MLQAQITHAWMEGDFSGYVAVRVIIERHRKRRCRAATSRIRRLIAAYVMHITTMIKHSNTHPRTQTHYGLGSAQVCHLTCATIRFVSSAVACSSGVITAWSAAAKVLLPPVLCDVPRFSMALCGAATAAMSAKAPAHMAAS